MIEQKRLLQVELQLRSELAHADAHADAVDGAADGDADDDADDEAEDEAEDAYSSGEAATRPAAAPSLRSLSSRRRLASSTIEMKISATSMDGAKVRVGGRMVQWSELGVGQ